MKIFTAWQESDGNYSWGRIAATGTVLVAMWGFVHVVRITNAIPDPTTLLGLGSFGGFPFALSKGIAAMARPTAGQ